MGQKRSRIIELFRLYERKIYLKFITDMYKSFVIILSESIWIYYTIVLFASIEWQQSAFFDSKWIIFSGFSGYILNFIRAHKRSSSYLFFANALALGLILVKNWISIVPEGSWLFGLAITIGLCLIFARSGWLAYKNPERQALLHHFEGNVICYIIFSVIFTANNWSTPVLHFLFMFSVINSLIGMTMTLQGHEKSEQQQSVKIIKAGQSRWFAGMGIVLLIGIPLFSFIFLIPSVSRTLHFVIIGIWEKLKWMLWMIGRFFAWLIGLLPDQKMEAVPGAPQNQQTLPSEIIEEKLFDLPYMLIAVILIILISVAVIWYLSRLKLSITFPQPASTGIVVYKSSWRENLKNFLKESLHRLKRKFCMRFSCFYFHPIYWHYYQIVKWGEKNGFYRKENETSREFIKKIMDQVSAEEKKFSYKGETHLLSEMLWQLNEDYQAAYYGSAVKVSDGDYKIFIKYLHGLSLK